MNKWLALSLLCSSLASAKNGILYIGDSLSANGKFGLEIFEFLKTLSPHVRSVCGAGSAPKDWAPGKDEKPYHPTSGFWDSKNDKRHGRESRQESGKLPLLRDLIKEEQPATLIVQQGTNQIIWDQPEEKIESSLKTFLDAIPLGTRCLWIGPPDARSIPVERLERFYRVARKVLPPKCELIDSWKNTKYVGVDGVHYKGKTAEKPWIAFAQDRIKALLKRKSKHLSDSSYKEVHEAVVE